jgi:hypothetical protein
LSIILLFIANFISKKNKKLIILQIKNTHQKNNSRFILVIFPSRKLSYKKKYVCQICFNIFVRRLPLAYKLVVVNWLKYSRNHDCVFVFIPNWVWLTGGESNIRVLNKLIINFVRLWLLQVFIPNCYGCIYFCILKMFF